MKNYFMCIIIFLYAWYSAASNYSITSLFNNYKKKIKIYYEFPESRKQRWKKTAHSMEIYF